MKTMQLTQKQKILIGVGIAIFVAVLIFVLWYMITHPVFTAAVTDIWIIILALVVLVMNVFLIFMLWQIIRLIDFLLFELKPVLESLQETSNTVRGTASFVTEEVSSPIIDVSAKSARVKGSLRFVIDSLTNGGQRAGGGPQGAGYRYTGPQAGPSSTWDAADESTGGPGAGASEQPTP